MKVIIVNDSPGDVFFEHLSGNKSFELARMGFMEIIRNTECPCDLILTVNQKLDFAIKIKEKYSSVRVAAVFGGKKDFQPIVTFVYSLHDYDDLGYGSWKEFEELLLEPRPRPKKYLTFSRESGRDSVFKPNLPLLNSSLAVPKTDFVGFMMESTEISHHYLNWLRSWVEGAKKKVFPIEAPRKKKIWQLQANFLNEYLGLPIFTAGDSVTLADAGGNELRFEKNDLVPKMIIEEAEIDGIKIRFSKAVNFRQLEGYNRVKAQLAIQTRKIIRMENDLEILRNDSTDQSYFWNHNAARFIKSSIIDPFFDSWKINYPREIVLDEASQKILRDESQTKALLDMISDKPISKILGPAGTGKTFVAAIAARYFIDAGFNVLLVSHSNLGVDRLVNETAKHVAAGDIYRLGNNEEKVEAEAKKFRQELPADCTSNYNQTVRSTREPFRRGIAVAATIDHYLTSRDFRDSNFTPDVIICDEASRGLFPEMLPLLLGALYKVILIGDNRQLGNVPIPKVLLEYLRGRTGMSKSLEVFNAGFFDSLVGSKYLPSSLLRINRRALPKLSGLTNFSFYGGELLPGRFNPYHEGSLVFLDTKNLSLTAEKREGKSWYNPLEVNIVIERFISQARKCILEGGKITDLVIITPYKAQVRLFKRKLRRELLFNKVIATQVNPENIDDILNQLVITVDAIQGGERKIVFVSQVRSNDRQDIGFNKDVRRLNVATSRAQEMLIIIGNSQTFVDCEHEPIKAAFGRMIKYIKKEGSYVGLRSKSAA
jgi:hypothetical protein